MYFLLLVSVVEVAEVLGIYRYSAGVLIVAEGVHVYLIPRSRYMIQA